MREREREREREKEREIGREGDRQRQRQREFGVCVGGGGENTKKIGKVKERGRAENVREIEREKIHKEKDGMKERENERKKWKIGKYLKRETETERETERSGCIIAHAYIENRDREACNFQNKITTAFSRSIHVNFYHAIQFLSPSVINSLRH